MAVATAGSASRRLFHVRAVNAAAIVGFADMTQFDRPKAVARTEAHGHPPAVVWNACQRPNQLLVLDRGAVAAGFSFGLADEAGEVFQWAPGFWCSAFLHCKAQQLRVLLDALPSSGAAGLSAAVVAQACQGRPRIARNSVCAKPPRGTAAS
jgi:hypothetical protein